MPELSRISPTEAQAMCATGAVYVDVRSEPEFADGHPAGAVNVPFLHQGATGLVANPDFGAVMQANFPRDQPIVLGCKSGGRSLKAAAALRSAGYVAVVDQRAGFDGARDAFGALTEPGWRAQGLPVETAAPAGQTYGELLGRAAR